ncbi:hypothetical protein [Streptomyces daghestanicus]|uniref:Uncharacterized protein n=1 Tax=Streptomyces daghestanicus TaxID=66885 RepID=A0ABQ3QDN3_9ACTN|nr:hypothetical protein [Streptomyces daghestanicus]GGU16881.1 hypothetical protein GCM10010259_04190 [Streptomyces daghestanicus]GHI35400.1 hypothetical protein Sdagh_71300 [Streptomyces daghestanicus]
MTNGSDGKAVVITGGGTGDGTELIEQASPGTEVLRVTADVSDAASDGGIRGVGNQSGTRPAKHGVVGLTGNSGVEHGSSSSPSR